MTAPDPQIVREIAREYVLDDRHRVHDIGPAVLGRFGPDGLTKPEYHAYCDAVREAIAMATVTVSWPAEHDSAYSRLREFADACDPDTEIIAGPPRHDAPYLSLSDLEAVLNGQVVLERIAEDAVAELKRQPPASVSGEQQDGAAGRNAFEADEPEPRPGHGPGVPGAMHLEAFGQDIRQAFGRVPYHVGSSATSKTWRDVDVRLILPDDDFDALFPGFKVANHIDAWWSLLCAALSELGAKRTGLPIDFQIQSMTEANEKYPSGIRNPLFLIRADEDQVPTMLAAAEQPEPCDGDCDCDCQPGQPCLCPERDCYCGPCPVCGPAPQQPAQDRQGA